MFFVFFLKYICIRNDRVSGVPKAARNNQNIVQVLS